MTECEGYHQANVYRLKGIMEVAWQASLLQFRPNVMDMMSFCAIRV
jgi:hypothetical protein